MVLERLANNELSYRYLSNTPGSQLRVWLKAFKGSAYEVVSKIVQYTVY